VRVALFITCFNDTLFPETGQVTVEVLERLGHEVEFPLEQTCCGQMHFNTGYQREAIPLVRRFVEVFSPYEAVVAPSGSCVGMVRELYPMAARLGDDERLGRTIENLAPKVFELSEFLVKKLGVTDVGALLTAAHLRDELIFRHEYRATEGTWIRTRLHRPAGDVSFLTPRSCATF